MNLDTYEKISNILCGIMIACACGLIFCINSTVAAAVLLLIGVACWVIKERLFKKVCEDHDSKSKGL